jgi:3-polyprenyl-4-hydroxybenzoate decarboxylase
VLCVAVHKRICFTAPGCVFGCRLLQALKKEGLILSLPAAETTRKEVFYPVDQRIHMKVDADLQVCWFSTARRHCIAQHGAPHGPSAAIPGHMAMLAGCTASAAREDT